jgi:hypothetical protein
MWTGLEWLRIGTGGELLWIRYWTFRFHKMLGNYRVSKQLGISIVVLSSVELVIVIFIWRWPFIDRNILRQKIKFCRGKEHSFVREASEKSLISLPQQQHICGRINHKVSNSDMGGGQQTLMYWMGCHGQSRLTSNGSPFWTSVVRIIYLHSEIFCAAELSQRRRKGTAVLTALAKSKWYAACPIFQVT